MDPNSCWKCGQLGHHRRDCPEEVDVGSAATNKRLALAAQRLIKKPPSVKRDIEKLLQRNNIYASPPPSVSHLKQMHNITV